MCTKTPNLAVCSVPLERLCKLQCRVEATKQDVFFVRRYPEYTSYHHYSAFKAEVTMVVVECQGKGLDIVIIICPGSAGEEPARRDPGQIPCVTGAAVRWQGSPEFQRDSKDRCNQQVNSYSEILPLFKIKFLLIYSNIVSFYCISDFSELQLNSSQYINIVII